MLTFSVAKGFWNLIKRETLVATLATLMSNWRQVVQFACDSAREQWRCRTHRLFAAAPAAPNSQPTPYLMYCRRALKPSVLKSPWNESTLPDLSVQVRGFACCIRVRLLPVKDKFSGQLL